MNRKSSGIEDILQIEFLDDPQINCSGDRVAYKKVGYTPELNFMEITGMNKYEPKFTNSNKLPLSNDESVVDFAWHPQNTDEIAVTTDNYVYLYCLSTEELTRVKNVEEPNWISWHSDGNLLSFTDRNQLVIYSVPESATLDLNVSVPDDIFTKIPFKWSASEPYLAVIQNDAETILNIFTVDENSEKISQRNTIELAYLDQIVGFDWLNEESLILLGESADQTQREYQYVQLSGGQIETDLIYKETLQPVLPTDHPLGSGTGLFAISSGASGYHHILIGNPKKRVTELENGIDIQEKGHGITQVTSGQFETRVGLDIDNSPLSWDDSGRRLAYITNEQNNGTRNISTVEISDDGSIRTNRSILVDEGTHYHLRWLPDSQYLLCQRITPRVASSLIILDTNEGRIHSKCNGKLI